MISQGEPFADYLNVSVPDGQGDAVMRGLMPLVDMFGLASDGPGVFRDVRSGGTFKRGKRGKVETFSASGALLAGIRVYRMLDDFLGAIADAGPHRVTMLHATADYVADGPEVVADVARRAYAGEVSLTRKAIQPGQVRKFVGMGVDGRETGTVYLGNRANADVWAKVYDKRHERLSRGFDDPGPLVRVEVAVQSDVGATLRDVQQPGPLFFRFASPSLVPRPPGVPDWVAHGEGFVCEARREISALERLQGLLDGSPDVARVCALARDAFGPDNARAGLSQLLAHRLRVAPGIGLSGAET